MWWGLRTAARLSASPVVQYAERARFCPRAHARGVTATARVSNQSSAVPSARACTVCVQHLAWGNEGAGAVVRAREGIWKAQIGVLGRSCLFEAAFSTSFLSPVPLHSQHIHIARASAKSAETMPDEIVLMLEPLGRLPVCFLTTCMAYSFANAP
eukprot:5324830-Pleurochrysis_carterae.AAC.3